MKRNHILLISALAVTAIGGTAFYYWKTVAAINAGSRLSKTDKLAQLVRASKSRIAVFSTNAKKPSPEVEQSRRWCNEAVASWAAYAERCAKAGSEIRDIAHEVLKCRNNHKRYNAAQMKSCLEFLRDGSCKVLEYEREELALSLPELALLKERAKSGKDSFDGFRKSLEAIYAGNKNIFNATGIYSLNTESQNLAPSVYDNHSPSNSL